MEIDKNEQEKDLNAEVNELENIFSNLLKEFNEKRRN